MPDRPRVVVVNTTPLIALAEIRQFSLLQRLYGEIAIPPQVQQEILAGGVLETGVADFREARWIRVVKLQDERRAEYFSDLDLGEAQVIALAEEIKADLVIIDERLGRKHAQRLGLNVTGSAGVLVKAKELGLIPEVGSFIRLWEESGRLWLSENLKKQILRQAGEE